MAYYADEDELWKCPKHPSRLRRTCGVCPACLHDRLSALCPRCAHTCPCACCPTSATSSSSSPSSSFSATSSSFSRFSADPPPCSAAGVRVSALIAAEPPFRRSRSAAIPILRSRFDGDKPPAPETIRKSSIWSVFKRQKSDREKIDDESADKLVVITRSRSMAAPESATSSPKKGRGWHFLSPMKAFRRRSPLYRG